MKLQRVIFLTIAGLIITFALLNQHSRAQQSKATTTHNWLGTFGDLEISLMKSGQTNTALQVDKVVQETQALKDSLTLFDATKYLRELRNGQTNEVINQLESDMDYKMVAYDPKTHNEDLEQAILEVQQYRKQYPYKSGDTNLDERVEQLFHAISP